VEAGYTLDDKPTLTLLASKLPVRMMEHVYKVVRPLDFSGWADAARQYHQDHVAVQNIRGIFDETWNPQKKKATSKPTRFSAEQLARILDAEEVSADSDAMDVDEPDPSSRLRYTGWRKRGRDSTTSTSPDSTETEQQRREGRCFTCNRQGHISKHCPKKIREDKAPVRTHSGETSSGAEGGPSSGSSSEDEALAAFIRLGHAMSKTDKLTLFGKANTTKSDF
jgi:hypothetical protein